MNLRYDEHRLMKIQEQTNTERDGEYLLPNACEATIKRQRMIPSHKGVKYKSPARRGASNRTKLYGGKYPPSNLIPLPALENGKVRINDVWSVWNSTLRNLDVWHKGLIAAKYRMKFQSHYDGWAGSWFTKYRYFREIGVEIDERLAKNDGLSEDDLVDRLETVRQNIKHNRSIQALVDGLRLERGSKPFNSKRKTGFDISGELKKQFDEVCPTYLWKA
jgi:hypothetical protein